MHVVRDWFYQRKPDEEGLGLIIRNMTKVLPPGKSKCADEAKCTEEELARAVANPEEFGMKVEL
jgi:hypothetical protein